MSSGRSGGGAAGAMKNGEEYLIRKGCYEWRLEKRLSVWMMLFLFWIDLGESSSVGDKFELKFKVE